MNIRPFSTGILVGAALALAIAATPAQQPPPSTTVLAQEIAGLKYRVASLELIVSGADPYTLGACLRAQTPTPVPAPEPPRPASTPTPPLESAALIPATVSPIPLPGATVIP